MSRAKRCDEQMRDVPFFPRYRRRAVATADAPRVTDRRGNDWTSRFRKITADAWHVNAGSAIIDGEVVVPAADGSTDFSFLQNELKGRSKHIVLVAFDLAVPERP